MHGLTNLGPNEGRQYSSLEDNGFFLLLFLLRKSLSGRYCPREEVSSADLAGQADFSASASPCQPHCLPAFTSESQKVLGSRLPS